MNIYGTISYGNLTFHTYTNSKANIEPNISEDGVSIESYRTTINVDFLVAIDTVTVDANGINSIDASMDYIKQVLSTRGLTLRFAYVGFGTVDPVDIANGPVPKILSWVPLGSNVAARCSWQVEVTTINCPLPAETSVLSVNQFKILSLVEETNFEFDEEGAVNVNTHGLMKVASNSFLTRKRLKDFAAQFNKSILPNFHRKIRFLLRNDHRSLEYSINDVEIKSDNPLYPYMVAQDIDHEVSSNLLSADPFEGMGFVTWANELSGDFTVAPGKWKGWAWIAFCNALNHRRNRATPWLQGVDKFAKAEEDVEGDTETPKVKQNKRINPKQITLSCRIRESLNSRRVSASVRWVTYTSIDQLFKSTGLFYPVDVIFDGIDPANPPMNPYAVASPSMTNQWTAWKATNAAFQSFTGFRNVSPPNFDLIFSVCNNDQQVIQANHSGNYYSENAIAEPFRPSNKSDTTNTYEKQTLPLGEAQYPLSDQPTVPSNADYSKYLAGLTKELSWVTYKNAFEIIEVANSVKVPTIEVSAQDKLRGNSTLKTLSDKTQGGFQINGNNPLLSVQDDYQNDLVQIRGNPQYYVRMRGWAVRLGWSVPSPVLLAANDRPCYRMGTNRWSHTPLNVSDEIPVYLGMWDVMYGISGSPVSDNIKFDTSGKPAEFS